MIIGGKLQQWKKVQFWLHKSKEDARVCSLDWVREVLRESSKELGIALGLCSTGAVCGASREPISKEMLDSVATSRIVVFKLVLHKDHEEVTAKHRGRQARAPTSL